MGDKPDLRDVIASHVVTETAENIVTINKEKISASPLVQGFILGYVCARFPIGLFLAAGVGFLGGLYLEENFRLPDLKDVVLSTLPEKRKKDD